MLHVGRGKSVHALHVARIKRACMLHVGRWQEYIHAMHVARIKRACMLHVGRWQECAYKSANMTQKKFFLQNINMGIQKTQNFMLISNMLMPAFRNAPNKS